MNPKLLEKIRRLAADSRTDPMTRKIAQAQLEAHTPTPPRNQQHPGLKQSEEYQTWARTMKRSNRGRKPATSTP